MQNAAGAIRCPLGQPGVGVSGTCGWHQLAGFIIWGRTAPWGEEALEMGHGQELAQALHCRLALEWVGWWGNMLMGGVERECRVSAGSQPGSASPRGLTQSLGAAVEVLSAAAYLLSVPHQGQAGVSRAFPRAAGFSI